MAMADDTYDGDVARSREIAQRFGSEFVDLNGFQIQSDLLRKVPVELMFRYNFVPIEVTQNGRLAIAIADPSQLMMIDEISLLLNRRVITRISTLKQISDTLKRTEEAQRGNDE